MIALAMAVERAEHQPEPACRTGGVTTGPDRDQVMAL
jgi:hypothetical protein